MKSKDYVIINNRAYDPVTGLPVEIEDVNLEAETSVQVSDSGDQIHSIISRGITTPNVHQTMQRSATLSRRHVKRPSDNNSAEILELAAKLSSQYVTIKPKAQSPIAIQHSNEIQKSPAIQRFPTTPPVATHTNRADRPAQTHPMMYRAANRQLDVTPRTQRVASRLQRDIRSTRAVAQVSPIVKPQVTNSPVVAKPAVATKPAQVLKNEAIHKALSNEIATNQKATKSKKLHKSSRWSRFASLATASFAIILLAGYFTYLSMPNLAIRMAAVQSGVNAKYPGYRPDGYALRGPITSRDGEVDMKFAYASDDQGFTLKQKRSAWDSSAAKQFVESRSDNVSTTTVDGLTIYTYDSNAVWVNSGVLYTIESDAPLSGSQIQRIATSM